MVKAFHTGTFAKTEEEAKRIATRLRKEGVLARITRYGSDYEIQVKERKGMLKDWYGPWKRYKPNYVPQYFTTDDRWQTLFIDFANREVTVYKYRFRWINAPDPYGKAIIERKFKTVGAAKKFAVKYMLTGRKK